MDDNSKKMEDDLTQNGKRPQKKNGRQPKKNGIQP
jgi:hypothetical protein